jgi:hypothetical protein
MGYRIILGSSHLHLSLSRLRKSKIHNKSDKQDMYYAAVHLDCNIGTRTVPGRLDMPNLRIVSILHYATAFLKFQKGNTKVQAF